MGHTTYSGHLLKRLMDEFAWSTPDKVTLMQNFELDKQSDNLNKYFDPYGYDLSLDEDLVMEQILANLNETPLGQVLKKIAALPEIRKDKVLDVRQQLTNGSYDLNSRLDDALEKVLEDLTL